MFSVLYKPSSNSVQAVALKQIKAKVEAVMSSHTPTAPKDGWIRTIRTALGMSGAQLANRLGFSRNKVSILERREASGEITLNQLREMAGALDADLIYAVVPRKSIDTTIDERAQMIAEARLSMSYQNMFLEAQQISEEMQNEAKQNLTKEIKDAGGKILWKSDMLEQDK